MEQRMISNDSRDMLRKGHIDVYLSRFTVFGFRIGKGLQQPLPAMRKLLHFPAEGHANSLEYKEDHMIDVFGNLVQQLGIPDTTSTSRAIFGDALYLLRLSGTSKECTIDHEMEQAMMISLRLHTCK
jgi:hypothetical protein